MMKPLTLVWTLTVTLTLCCDGAMIYDPMLQQDTVWYNPGIQYSELVDKKSVGMVESMEVNTNKPMSLIGSINALMNQLGKQQNNNINAMIKSNEQKTKEIGKRSRYPYFDVPYNRF
ncbi:Hypothetical protein CINCED_3A017625 [Cinara cedri]|uniref:Uncharacterized protein n=1 Tax=Cinara cedri TaxID=506608 RepID=A0A5E4NIM5_9HEMI|nr:Hypothetical protein CINCED_3A017625 [Cinara cedri]